MGGFTKIWPQVFKPRTSQSHRRRQSEAEHSQTDEERTAEEERLNAKENMHSDELEFYRVLKKLLGMEQEFHEEHLNLPEEFEDLLRVGRVILGKWETKDRREVGRESRRWVDKVDRNERLIEILSGGVESLSLLDDLITDDHMLKSSISRISTEGIELPIELGEVAKKDWGELQASVKSWWWQNLSKQKIRREAGQLPGQLDVIHKLAESLCQKMLTYTKEKEPTWGDRNFDPEEWGQLAKTHRRLEELKPHIAQARRLAQNLHSQGSVFQIPTRNKRIISKQEDSFYQVGKELEYYLVKALTGALPDPNSKAFPDFELRFHQLEDEVLELCENAECCLAAPFGKHERAGARRQVPMESLLKDFLSILLSYYCDQSFPYFILQPCCSLQESFRDDEIGCATPANQLFCNSLHHSTHSFALHIHSCFCFNIFPYKFLASRDLFALTRVSWILRSSCIMHLSFGTFMSKAGVLTPSFDQLDFIGLKSDIYLVSVCIKLLAEHRYPQELSA
ncbi:hypothetical protein T439DRAFT_372686 [Meredithblackwellia eburnea MCA 4105]